MAQRVVNIPMDEQIKDQADVLFSAFGFTFAAAVNAFVKEALREQSLLFQPKPKRTHKSFSERMKDFKGVYEFEEWDTGDSRCCDGLY